MVQLYENLHKMQILMNIYQIDEIIKLYNAMPKLSSAYFLIKMYKNRNTVLIKMYTVH